MLRESHSTHGVAFFILTSDMIQFIKGALNTFYLTLQEKISDSDNYLLLELRCQATDEIIYTLPRSHSFDARKDTLTLREGDSNNPTGGDILMNTDKYPAGFWEYRVLEQTSATNLDPNDSSVVGELERGIMNVYESTPVFGVETFTAYSNDEVQYTYQRQ